MTDLPRQIAHTVTSRGMAFALGGVASILIARTLGPEGRGIYSVIAAVATTASTLGHLSIDQSQAALWTTPGHRRALRGNSLPLGLAAGALTAAVTTVLLAAFGSAILPTTDRVLSTIALLVIPCNLVLIYANNILILQARIEVINRCAVGAAAFQCAAMAVLAAMGRLTVTGVIVVWAVATALPLPFVIAAVRPRPRDRDRALAARTITLGLRYHAGLVGTFLMLRVDVLLLSGLAGAVAVGHYAVAVTIIELSRVTAEVIAQAVLHRQVEGDAATSAAFTAATVRMGAILSVGTVGSLCLAAPVLLPTLYGAAFTASVPLLLGLAPGLAALAATRTVTAYLLRLDRPLLLSAVAVTALAGNVTLNLLLIPAYGAFGCALASSVSYCALGAAHLWMFRRASGTAWRELLPRRTELTLLRAMPVRLLRLRQAG